ncbi:MAG: CopG family ribbon-helix-helix protein [Alphaproteobacteria bacterium]|nr:CopG family ribbon-helix-helix protein [Alphaproteobacteria bacterium]
MAKSTVMTIRLAPEINAKLEALSQNLKRSKSWLAGEAIASYVELNAWQVAHIKEAIDEDETGEPGVPHAEIVEWMDSWGSEHELPRPIPKKP